MVIGRRRMIKQTLEHGMREVIATLTASSAELPLGQVMPWRCATRDAAWSVEQTADSDAPAQGKSATGAA